MPKKLKRNPSPPSPAPIGSGFPTPEPCDECGVNTDELLKERDRLQAALKDANDLCRSAYQVAKRNGRKTNWPAFRDCLRESLERQHAVMYPPNKDSGGRSIWETCPECNGWGFIYWTGAYNDLPNGCACDRCHSTGHYYPPNETGQARREQPKT